MKSKVCTKCGIEKNLEDFHNNRRGVYGKTSRCKECINEDNRISKGSEKMHKEVVCDVCGCIFIRKSYNQKRCSDECRKKWLKGYNLKYHAEYYDKNSEYVKSKVKEYRENNKEKYSQQKKEQYNKHKDSINKRLRKYKKQRRKNDVNYRIKETLSRRISVAIKRQFTGKADKTTNLLGCSIQEAMTHLEKQFQKGMSWNNYGEWHIDHRIPCASFDLTDPEEQKACFHFTNLQPLWAKDNIKKSDKIEYLL